MLPFRKISLDDRAMVTEYFAIWQNRICECCFADLYIWSHKYNTSICEQDGFLYIRANQVGYMLPQGKGDLKKALTNIRADAAENGWDFKLFSITDDMRDLIEQFMPGEFVYTENRDYCDYIYRAAELINLTGRKFHAKRNFINRFTRQYFGRYTYEDITPANIKEVWHFQEKWSRQNDVSSSEDLQAESTAIAVALNNFDQLGFEGGMLKIDDQVVAFTLGARIARDTFGIQIEKADYEIPGTYPMINWEFAKRHCAEVEYINREEDLGIAGLRQAKLSYNPVLLLCKRTAVIKA
jgi:hypothetical protein